MQHLTAHHLRFWLEVETTIELDEHQGSAMRGLLFHALRGPARNPALGFCTQRHLKTCTDCALVAVCPVASLVSTLNPEAERGRDVPRPYAIVPPLDNHKKRYEPGERLSFGLTLFGNALNLFPYVVMGLRQAERNGLGKKLPRPEASGRFYRGRFTVQSAQAINLLTGEVQDVLKAGSTMVQRPSLPVTHDQIMEASVRMLSREISGSTNGRRSRQQQVARQGAVEVTVTFKTPTRIVENGKLLAEPYFSPIFHRLVDRLIALKREFAPGEERVGSAGQPARTSSIVPEVSFDKPALLALADSVELVAHQSSWEEVWSYSARQERKIPISGITGQATYRAPADVWAVLLPYLLWGSVTHVGKNAVKGDGIIAVSD